MDKTMDRLRDMACEHLDKIAKEDKFTNETLNDTYKLIDIVLDTYKVDEHKDGGYSQRGYSYDRMHDGYSYNRMNDGYSRGDGEWTANGHYSNRMDNERWNDRYSGRRYSRESGRSRMIGKLENMASDAEGMDREALYNCIERLKED